MNEWEEVWLWDQNLICPPWWLTMPYQCNFDNILPIVSIGPSKIIKKQKKNFGLKHLAESAHLFSLRACDWDFHKLSEIGSIGIRGCSTWNKNNLMLIPYGFALPFRSYVLLSELTWHVLPRGYLNCLLLYNTWFNSLN